MIRLRISPDGIVQGLWTDGVDWASLGSVSVRRASHIEFCDCSQMWYVRCGRPISLIRRVVQRVLKRPLGEIVHWAKTRQEALAWEQNHYQPGGPGWPAYQVVG